MAIETNGIDRVPLIKIPTKVFDIFNANDLLKAAGLTAQITAPDGVSRTPLLEDARYVIHAAFTLPKLLLPETSSTTSALATEFVGAQARSRVFVNGNNDGVPIFWGREVNQLVFTDFAIIDIGNSGSGQSSVLFDITGGARTSRLTATNTTFAQIGYLGSATDFTLSFNPNVNLVSIGRGIVFDVSPFDIVPSANALLAWRLINAFDITMHGPYIGFTGTHVTTSIDAGTSTMSANDEFVRIDGNAVGNWDLVGNSYDGVGELLSEGNVSTNTLYANQDLVIDSFSDSTEDPGVDTTVNLAAITKFKRGQTVLIADEAAYDGEHVIVRVASDQLSFDINVVHSTSGAGTLKQTRVTSTSHGFMLNENMTISGTVAYDGAQVVNQIVDNDTYEIPFAFATAETVGTATSVSKNQKDEGIESELNGEAPSSKRIASGLMNGNIGTTTFSTADTYIGMNLGTVIDDQLVTERFTLTNSTIGLYTYNDPRPITVNVNALAWLVKSGATQNYRLALDKNGNAPVFTTTITAVIDNGSGIARFLFTPGPTLVVGQRFIVKNYTTNTDYNGNFVIDTVGAGYFEIDSIPFGTNEAGGEFENAYSVAEIQTTSIISHFSEFIDLAQNDTLRIRIAPDGHTDTCTVTDVKLSIVGI